MTEEIIQAITEAETQAAEIRRAAQAQAAAIIAEAEAHAAETEKTTREACKTYRTAQTAASNEAAQREYEETVAEKTAAARAYCADVAEGVEAVIAEIVGRITSGNS
jgi:vacuolar-type H+-ATPase subunit H